MSDGHSASPSSASPAARREAIAAALASGGPLDILAEHVDDVLHHPHTKRCFARFSGVRSRFEHEMCNHSGR